MILSTQQKIHQKTMVASKTEMPKTKKKKKRNFISSVYTHKKKEKKPSDTAPENGRQSAIQNGGLAHKQ